MSIHSTKAESSHLQDIQVIPWLDRIKDSMSNSRGVKGGNFMQIGTVDSGGRPRVRTVVFRGWLNTMPNTSGGAPYLKMITDTRSSKCSHIATNTACEAVYWFGKTSEQYRIDGELLLVGAKGSSSSADNEELQNARRDQWKQLRDTAREQFYWNAPGEFMEHTEKQIPPGGRSSGTNDILDPPDCFALLLLQPSQVKYLRLTDNYAQEDSISDERIWKSRRMNP